MRAPARWQLWSAPEPVGAGAQRSVSPPIIVVVLFGLPGSQLVAFTGRLIDVQRLEQVIEAAGEVLPEHVARRPLIPPSRLRKNP